MSLKVLFYSATLFALMISCKNDTNKESEPISPTDTRATMEYNENRIDSIPETITEKGSFLGGGGEPFWSVEMTNNTIRFQSANEKFKVFSATFSDPEISGNTKTYISETEEGTIKVSILKELCEDNMKGEKNSYKVMVAIKHTADKEFKNFEGCGMYKVE